MTVYEWQEKTYLQYDNARSSFKDSLTNLYTMMLSYEAALLVHLGQNSPKQWLDSIVNAGDWSGRLKDIQDQDTKCRLITTAISEELRVKWHQEEIKWHQDLLQLPRTAKESDNLRKLYSNYEAGKNINPDRVPGTCQWFLNHVDFLTWRKSQSSRLLWLSADPGCGKSVLAKYLVDRKGEALGVQKIKPTVCYFFFKDGDIERRDGAKAVCALLHQLFMQKPQLYRHAKEDFRTKNDSFLTDIDTVWNILMKVLQDSSQSETVCVLDALDECRENSRKALIDKIVHLYSEGNTVDKRRPIVKFLVTSRPEMDIVRDFDLTEVRLRGEEESEQISQEIDLVIKNRVQAIGKRMRLNRSQQSSLQESLTSITQRTYLWLHLTFDAIEKRLMLTGKDIEALVSVIPENVDQAYTAMLNKSPDKDKSRKLLHIILAAKRPLSLEQINVAMVIDHCHKNYHDLEMWPQDHATDIVKNICGLFISVVASKVYLIHQTAREFLLGEYLDGWSKSFRLAESNLVLAKVCIWLLQLRDFEENDLRPQTGSGVSLLSAESQSGSEDTSSVKMAETTSSNDQQARTETSNDEQSEEEASEHNQSDYDASSADKSTELPIGTDAQSDNEADSLLMTGEFSELSYDRLDPGIYILYNYAACFWKDHFTEAADLPGSSLIEMVANRLCSTTSFCFINWNHWSSQGWIDLQDASNIIIACRLGLTAVVKLLLDQGSNVDSESHYRGTPLHVAAEKGHAAVVELLLDQGANINLATKYNGFTPLHTAALYLNQEVVDLLLKRGAEINSMNHIEATPLHLAARFQRSGAVINLLVDKGAQINSLNHHGKTPMFFATNNGNENACKQLLEAGARTDITDNDGRTLLHHAASSGGEAVVQIFLDRDIELNLQDNAGETALMNAVRWGSFAVVRLLLKAGARTDITDNDGKTLLHHAALGDNEAGDDEAIVQLLLDREIEVNLQDNDGRTALMDAANAEVSVVVRLLLKAGARTDIVNNDGQTVLHVAASRAHEKIIQMLLDRDVQVNFKDQQGQTALLIAAGNENSKVVELLLERNARTDIKYNGGETVLHRAATFGSLGVVQVFLDRDVDVNCQDENGMTALSHAAEKGRPAVTKLLLERSARVDLKDKYGQTPYWIAKTWSYFYADRPRKSADYDAVLELLKKE